MRAAWRAVVATVGAAAWLGAGCGGAGEGMGGGTPIDAGLDFGIWFPDGSDPGGGPADPGSTQDPGGGGADPGVGPTDTAGSDPGVNPGCPNGTACNDQDPCTYNDQCQGGVCQGQPIDCGADDGLPCTFNGCQGGACVSGVEPGFCAAGGACWSQGQVNPTNPCQKCDPFADDDAWTQVAGGCDDGDDCTLLDECVAGQCTGVAVNCSDGDANPCNDEACVGGACQPVGNNGKPCDDGDPCTMGEACSGTFCSGGTPLDADNDGVPPVSCGGTDCNDASALAKPGLAEVCDDGLDNDCNGQTDSADAACGGGGGVALGEPCQYHADCYPQGTCAYWYTDGVARCSKFCSGNSECSGGHVCHKLPGSANVGFCGPPVPDGLPDGSGCSVGADCASGVCNGGLCLASCLAQPGCAGGTCGLFGDPAAGSVLSACGQDATLRPSGQSCVSPDGMYYEGSFCASGHCDFMTYPAEPYFCAPLCRKNTDCGGLKECNFVLYAGTPNATAVLFNAKVTEPGYEAYQSPRDAAMACFTPYQPFGSLPDGSSCSAHSQCQGGRCLGMGDDGAPRCTRFCTVNMDCAGPNMECQVSMLSMVSDFLINFGGDQYPVDQGVLTYVRLCTLK